MEQSDRAMDLTRSPNGSNMTVKNALSFYIRYSLNLHLCFVVIKQTVRVRFSKSGFAAGLLSVLFSLLRIGD